MGGSRASGVYCFWKRVSRWLGVWGGHHVCHQGGEPSAGGSHLCMVFLRGGGGGSCRGERGLQISAGWHTLEKRRLQAAGLSRHCPATASHYEAILARCIHRGDLHRRGTPTHTTVHLMRPCACTKASPALRSMDVAARQAGCRPARPDTVRPCHVRKGGFDRGM